MTSIKDVAKKAGVSASTVSYAISGKRAVSKDAKRRVMKAARELNYSPNAGAQILRGSKTHILALSSPMYSSTDYGSYMDFFLKVVQRARFHGYDVLLLAGDNEDEELLRIVKSGLADGVVLLDVDINDSRLKVAEATSVPFISIGDPGDISSVNAVDIDFTRMGVMAVNELADYGHRKILFIGGQAEDYARGSNFLVRLRDAIYDQARRRGVDIEMVNLSETKMPEIQALVDAEFSWHPDITAVLAQTDLVQMGNIVMALERSGRSIPSDVSVMSLGMGGDASTLSTPIDGMPLLPDITCTRGIDILMDMIAGKMAGSGNMELAAPRYEKCGSVGPAKN